MIDELRLIHSISSHLKLFKAVNAGHSYRFRCNICGDSQKSELKSRGFFIFSKQEQCYFFKCHNCGISLSLINYAKKYFPEEYKAIKFEQFKESTKTNQTYKPNEKTIEFLKNIKPKESIPHLFPVTHSNKCLEYVKSRKLPESEYYRLYYTDNISALVHSLDEHKKYANHKLPTDERLVLILRDKEGNIKGIQGRSLPDNPTKLRYATYMFSDDNKFFGLETIDASKDIIVTEGAIDSLFLKNAIAINGGSSANIKELEDLKSKFIIALDNEPRHKDTISRFKKYIKDEYRVVDWSNIKTEAKDINDMVLSGLNPEDINNYILNNNTSGAKATLKLTKWNKV